MLFPWRRGEFDFFNFICLLLCAGCTRHGMRVKLRGWLSGVSSLLPLSVLGVALGSPGSGSKHFESLSHLASSRFKLCLNITELATFPHQSSPRPSVCVYTLRMYLKCCTIVHILLPVGGCSCYFYFIFYFHSAALYICEDFHGQVIRLRKGKH